jgi:hypothetical protein
VKGWDKQEEGNGKGKGRREAHPLFSPTQFDFSRNKPDLTKSEAKFSSFISVLGGH